MAYVLSTDSTVSCGHSPGEVATSSQAKLTVNGAAVLLADSISGKSVSGCPQSSSNTSPCLHGGAPLPSSLATKLTAGGAPVVLDALSGPTDGSPPGTMSASNVQQKLSVS